MTNTSLDERFWTQDFAVTDGDLNRLYAFLQKSGRPQKAVELLTQVVRRKLEKESLEVNAQQRRQSEAAAQRLLQDQIAKIYQQTEDYEEGERLLVGWQADGERHFGVGEVVEKAVANAPHYRWIIRLLFSDGSERPYIAGANLSHPEAKAKEWKPFDIQGRIGHTVEEALDEVLKSYDATLLPHLLGRLGQDERFVQWAQSCWLIETLPALPEDTLEHAAAYLWGRGTSATTETLLEVLGLPIDELHHWALNLAMAERFDNAGTEENPQWMAALPDHLLRLSDGTLVDLSMSPDALWAQHHALFRDPPPEEWSDNPHVLTFGGRWLLDVLLIPLEDEDLRLVREYLQEEGQAVSDTDILEGLFGITPRDDAFDRWRFTLSYRLQQKAQELGMEFVGSGRAWLWALEEAPIEKPERHRRLRGTEGLPTKYVEVEQIAAELARDDEPLDEPSEEQPQEWKPTRQTWEYVLTYCDWDNGVLPYHREVREMIPPLNEDQRRAVLQLVAEQVDDDPFEVALYAHSRAPWLHGMGLKDFFVGYLVPGARIWVDRTEEPGLYKIRYRPTEPQRQRLLFFEDGRVRPVIREVEIGCEVDKTMLLAEGRYSDIEALARLDLADRRTAPKVLARVFELVGQKDERRGLFCACFDDIFPVLCITKPYSKAYVRQILYDRQRYPWFYSDEERGPGWFVYDPAQARVKRERERVVVKPPQPATPRPAEGVWDEVASLLGRELKTLDHENPFRILGLTDTSLEIQVGSTGQPRTIGRNEIEDAWQHLISQQALTRTEIHAEYSEFNPAYVAAILAALPGVTHRIRPIRLFYQPSGARQQTETAQATMQTPSPDEKTDLLWRHVASLASQEMRTLSERKPFTIEDIAEREVLFRISTGDERKSTWADFERSWHELLKHGTLDLEWIANEINKSTASYIAAVFAELPDVEYETGPIRLFYRPAHQQESVQPIEDIPIAETAAYFIFQQRTSEESEYADRVGQVYNWRQGIPGSNQIEEGAHFIYYRPGERVFFGSGRVDRIEEYVGEDGQTYCDGHIADYEPWEPALPLTRDLAKDISFIEPHWLGVGQAGIRKVSQADFEAIANAYHELQAQADAAETAPPTKAAETPAPKLGKRRPEQDRLIDVPTPLEEWAQTEHDTDDTARTKRFGAPSAGTSDQPTPAAPPTESGGGEPLSPPAELSRPAPSPTPRTSKSLFSQHYLENRIQEHEEWNEYVGEPFARLRALYERKRNILSQLNEAQTEEEFIRPVLELLGFAYAPQPAVRRGSRVQRPDYALFPDLRTKDEAYGYVKEEPAFYGRALAIADAKYWERSLSQTSRDDPRDEFKNTNPSFQIVNYLVGTEVDWGILTNGRHWRLYYRQASSTATEFYEVDLVDLLEQGDVEAFKYFWLFFRRDAFIDDAQGNNFLERVREGSATYARVIGNKLKDLVFDEVFPLLAGGFVIHAERRGEDLTGEDARRQVYEATLSFLYKALFLLYAEARALLPMDNPGYRNVSITNMMRGIAQRIDQKSPLGERSTGYYDNLLNLFRLVDGGDTGLGLPRYNGGLFHFDFGDPRNHEKYAANWFLTMHKIPDRFLAEALDRLVRIDGEPIDYGFIGVRHLGAMYEGLLEHKLMVDDAAQGEAHLETDKGERKATGSYYTPDYIVKYIVQHTVGPVLEERARRFATLMKRIADVRRQLADGRRTASIPALREELDRLEHQARETLLDIKVCDPAMGSGHFLVETVDVLTDGLIQILDEYPEHNPVLSMLDHIRQDIVASLGRQGIAVDPARLDDTQLLQRVVMKRCIYGVDLNLMAVELAKVSLWLHSFTIGAPLSFLDHHLRRGNSLIGAMTREVDEDLRTTKRTQRVSREARMVAEARGHTVREVATGYQAELWGGPFAGLLRAAEIMRGISLLSDATFAEVEESERLFRQFDEAAKPFKRLLDIYVARYFDVKHADEFLRLYGADAIQAGPDTVGEPYATVMRETRRVYEEKRFFHWDLEFPEVFIDLKRAAWKENPGFDAVVGNPPYGLIDTLPWFPELQNDAFVYFWKLGIDKTKSHGYLSLITPATWLTGLNYRSMRHILLEGTQILRIVGLPYDVFPGAYIDTCVAVVEIGRPTRYPIRVKQMGKHDDPREAASSDYDVIKADSWRHDPNEKFVLLPEAAELQRFRDLPRFVELGRLIRVERGVQPYSRSKHTEEQIRSDFLRVHEPPPEHQWGILYPELLGEELSRYRIEPAKRSWLKYSDELASKRDEGFFTRPRVVLRRLLSRRRELMAATTDQRLITTDNILNILIEAGGISEGYVAALLNSKLIAWTYTNTSTISVKDDFPQVTYEELKGLPVRRIAFTTPPDERARLVEAGITEVTGFTKHTEGATSVSFRAFSDSVFSRWLDERLSPLHTPDPQLVRRHNADPLNQDWQLPEEGPVEQSDVVHDLLAHLAEQMIEMNRQKQAEIKAFLGWLEDYTGLPLDDWKLKTIVRAYHEKGWDELLRALRRNARAITTVYVTGRDALAKIKTEFERSMDVLQPLLARIAGTDRLIDLIVYRLYGLTEEEVAIVEGRAS